MRRLVAPVVGLLLLALAGCLSPFTSRLDRLADRMQAIESKLDESNRYLKKMAGEE